MKRNHLSISQIWKQGLSLVVAGALTVSMLPAFSLTASAGAMDPPVMLKAGSIPAGEETRTAGEPFAKGTAGCERFRIPALITLQNGDLLATADARYGVDNGSDAPDGGGLDSIASVSSDGGKTWNYSFPFYFADSDGYPGDNTRTNATTIIDPGVVEGPDGTVYCVADVNPTGVTTMGGFHFPGRGTGYMLIDGEPRLALTSDYNKADTRPDTADDSKEYHVGEPNASAVYEYYVGDFDADGYAPVLSTADGSPSQYGVDEWYNLYTLKDGEYVDDLRQVQVKQESKKNDPDVMVQQNAFYAGSALHVYRTGYIMAVVSRDHGRTWEKPRILNTQIKREKETALLVSPGKGMTASNGDIAIGFYKTVGGEQASMVYSTDNGDTWQRTADIPTTAEFVQSSEDEIVELEDGTLRMFFRRGGYRDPVGALAYVDMTKQPDGTYQMGTPKGSGANLQTGCNLTAISYSKKIDGKQVIMVAGPSGIRANGAILTFLVNEDAEHTMELIHTFYVPEGQGGYASYVYSCMTELEDGSIGLVWEPNHYTIRYSHFDIHEVVPDREIDGSTASATKNVEIAKDSVYTEAYDAEGTVTEEPDAKIASLHIEEKTGFAMYDHSGTAVASSLDSFSDEANGALDLSDAEFTFISSGENWKIKNEAKDLYLTNAADANTFFSSDANDMTVTKTEGQDTFRICKSDGKRYIIFHAPAMNFNSNTNYTQGDASYEIVLLEKQAKASEGDSVIPGYSQASEIKDGGTYLICSLQDGKAIVLYPTNGTNAQTKLVDPSVSVTSKILSITGIGEGFTTAVVDGATYRIRVTEEHPAADAGCTHETVLRSVVPATCTEEGYSGDEICTKCNGVVKAGEKTPVLGHNWDAGTITKQVTRTENGEKVYTCQNDASHKKTEVIYASAYSQFMDVYEEAVSCMDDLGLYTEESAEALKAAYEAGKESAEGNTGRGVMYSDASALRAALGAKTKKSAFMLKIDLDRAVSIAAADISAQGNVPNEIWTAYKKAYENATAAALPDTPEGMWELVKALNIAQEKVNEAKKALAGQALTAAVSAAKAKIDAGKGSYTADSWNAFAAAYQAAANPPADADAAKLDSLKAALLKAQSGLKAETVPEPKPELKKGDTADAGIGRYQVLDAKKKTAALVKVLNKKTSKLNVPATVKINGVTCKVVQVGNKVLKGDTKLKKVILGKYVATVGKQAFMNCKNLKTVQLKGSALKTVKTGAFKKTSAAITVSAKKLNKKQKAALLKKLKKAGISKQAKMK